MIAKVPALTALQLQIGGLYRLQKQYDQAIATYQKVPEGDTNSDKAKIEIGMTQLEKSDLAAAETTLMGVAQGTSANKEVFYNLGEVKFAKGETDEAVKYYQRAVDIDPNWGKPLFKMGLAKLQKADTAGTLELMNKVVAVDPNSRRSGPGQGADRAAQEVSSTRDQGSGIRGARRQGRRGGNQASPKPQAPSLKTQDLKTRARPGC